MNFSVDTLYLRLPLARNLNIEEELLTMFQTDSSLEGMYPWRVCTLLVVRLRASLNNGMSGDGIWADFLAGRHAA